MENERNRVKEKMEHEYETKGKIKYVYASSYIIHCYKNLMYVVSTYIKVNDSCIPIILYLHNRLIPTVHNYVGI